MEKERLPLQFSFATYNEFACYKEAIEKVWNDRILLQDFIRKLKVPAEVQDELNSLDMQTIEMLKKRFLKSYDEHHEVPFDRPSESINGDNPHSYGDGSSSHSEAPQVFNDGFELDRMRATLVTGFNNPPLNNEVPSTIPDRGKDPFVDSNGSPQQRQELNRKELGEYIIIDFRSVKLDRKKRDYSMISESTLSIAGQAVGTMLSNIFSGSSNPSWTANFVAVATVFGIGFTLSGIGLRRVKPMLSGIMTKLGAVATASAIILALGQTVVPAVAWPAGAVACLLIYIGVAMA